jgi:hypothetical protein
MARDPASAHPGVVVVQNHSTQKRDCLSRDAILIVADLRRHCERLFNGNSREHRSWGSFWIVYNQTPLLDDKVLFSSLNYPRLTKDALDAPAFIFGIYPEGTVTLQHALGQFELFIDRKSVV